MSKNNISKDILFGVAIGDALGVPVEFLERSNRVFDPVVDMRGYGMYQFPAGTFSDDSSLSFCLAEALTQGYDLQKIANNFVAWLKEGYWTPHGSVFDVGEITMQALTRLQKGCDRPDAAGGTNEHDNGNGSLMRILPLLVYIKDKPIEERFQITKQVSSITHGHIRSVIGCFYYLEFAGQLINAVDKFQAYKNLQTEIPIFLHSMQIDDEEIKWYKRLLSENIYELPENKIRSGGYVVETLEASIWCLLTTDNYKDAVLTAVNLGADADTTAAVTGGLAGLLYGYDAIPKEWVNVIARREDIEGLAERLDKISEL